ncbi:MAG: hypothetical protein PWQ77_1414 [Kosmotogales bacterium]|nr:hypothetical protein [Kosmotogales bacterium]
MLVCDIIIFKVLGLVAQIWLELPAHNRAVGGSTPPEPTRKRVSYHPFFYIPREIENIYFITMHFYFYEYFIQDLWIKFYKISCSNRIYDF